MDRHSQSTERTILKLLLAGLAGIILLVGIAIGGYRFYQKWEGRHLVRRAEAYLSGGDLRLAALSARRAIQVNPSNVEACRILARIAESDGQSSAIEWRQAAVAAAPGSVDDVIALARTALQFDKITVAESALAKLDAAAEQVPAYHEVAAQLAVAKKDPATAEKHFAEAARLDPSNKPYQLNLAAFQLQSSSRDVRTTASNLLRTLMEDKTLRVAAARALRDYAIQQKDVSVLLEIAAVLHSYPEATFHDRISYAQVLHVLDHQDFASTLTALQNEAAPDSEKVTELLSWMSSNRLALLAIHWIRELPSEVVNKRPVPIAVADCYVAAGDWDGLVQWCNKVDWGDLKFLRDAYLSRALREKGDNLGSKSQWNAALQEAGSDDARIHALEQGAVKWGWKKEAADLLWILSKYPERQGAALAGLYQYYAEERDTGNLYRVAAKLYEIRPNDEQVQNNFSQLSLLLSVNVERAHQLIEQLYRKDPKNAVFASTYAFSLYLKGRYPQAAGIMSDLKPEDLREPAIAAYYGIFLAAAGDKAQAAEYLQRGSEAPLLPEEKTLLQSAREKIDGKSR